MLVTGSPPILMWKPAPCCGVRLVILDLLPMMQEQSLVGPKSSLASASLHDARLIPVTGLCIHHFQALARNRRASMPYRWILY
jgi:hypothetical protein